LPKESHLGLTKPKNIFSAFLNPAIKFKRRRTFTETREFVKGFQTGEKNGELATAIKYLRNQAF
jgi:hypothetical protein